MRLTRTPSPFAFFSSKYPCSCRLFHVTECSPSTQWMKLFDRGSLPLLVRGTVTGLDSGTVRGTQSPRRNVPVAIIGKD